MTDAKKMDQLLVDVNDGQKKLKFRPKWSMSNKELEQGLESEIARIAKKRGIGTLKFVACTICWTDNGDMAVGHGEVVCRVDIEKEKEWVFPFHWYG